MQLFETFLDGRHLYDFFTPKNLNKDILLVKTEHDPVCWDRHNAGQREPRGVEGPVHAAQRCRTTADSPPPAACLPRGRGVGQALLLSRYFNHRAFVW